MHTTSGEIVAVNTGGYPALAMMPRCQMRKNDHDEQETVSRNSFEAAE